MQTQWEKLKEEYVSSDAVTLRSLAERHGVSYRSVQQVSAAQGWAKEKREKLLCCRRGVEEGARQLQSAAAPPKLTQIEKINRIAERLLNNIEQGTELFEKPTHIATLTGALKDVTAILRDVNEIPTQKERQKYELDSRKLELDQLRYTAADKDKPEGGVVVLAEVESG